MQQASSLFVLTAALLLAYQHRLNTNACAFICLFSFPAAGEILRRQRDFVSLARSPHWWESIVCNMDNFSPERFRYFFRVKRERADSLVDMLRPRLQRNGPKAHSVKLIVHVALWRMAHGETEASVGERFGCGPSSVGPMLYDFCNALCAQMLADTVKLPTTDQLDEVRSAAPLIFAW